MATVHFATLFPRTVITEDNYSPINIVLTWIFLASMFFAVLAKVAVKMFYNHTFGVDDAAVILALTLGAGQSAAASVQILNGVGRHSTSLTTSQIKTYEKAGYSSAVLYIMSVAVSKTSVLILLRQITPIASHRRLTLVIGAFIAIWAFSSILASSFQCRLPYAWKILGPHCFDQISFWESNAVLNILTETALLALPTYTMWNVRIRMRQKVTVLGCFAFRVVVLGAVVSQLVLLNQLRNTTDVTFDSWSYQVTTQLVMSLSVVTVCIPYMRNVLMGFESGMFQTGAFRLNNLGTSKSPTHDSSIGPGSNNTATTPSVVPSGNRIRGDCQIFTGIDTRDGEVPLGQNTSVAEAASPREDWDIESQSSQAKIIKTTREWIVDYDGRKDGDGA